ncbi:hypothetical protein [Candidatus Methanodesulfokora washburnensis]|uniref:Uncharacterized protein n=1 Tax=Candidatus Methanodesulfokora washburnensis TaxID=2478471 RepID=A0A3R9PG28_9CREN|nr:hypothetical protein [Candidatus Methanodesulfokores washburnensis]RSN72464.1 hypothetical protein D6D85_13720 [Candidatus Methanodesulfokores washburnensis]
MAKRISFGKESFGLMPPISLSGVCPPGEYLKAIEMKMKELSTGEIIATWEFICEPVGRRGRTKIPVEEVTEKEEEKSEEVIEEAPEEVKEEEE